MAVPENNSDYRREYAGLSSGNERGGSHKLYLHQNHTADHIVSLPDPLSMDPDIPNYEEADLLALLATYRGRGRPKKHRTEEARKAARKLTLEKADARKKAKTTNLVTDILREAEVNRRLRQQYEAINREAEYFFDHGELSEGVKDYVMLVKEIGDFVAKRNQQELNHFVVKKIN